MAEHRLPDALLRQFLDRHQDIQTEIAGRSSLGRRKKRTRGCASFRFMRPSPRYYEVADRLFMHRMRRPEPEMDRAVPGMRRLGLDGRRAHGQALLRREP